MCLSLFHSFTMSTQFGCIWETRVTRPTWTEQCIDNLSLIEGSMGSPFAQHAAAAACGSQQQMPFIAKRDEDRKNNNSKRKKHKQKRTRLTRATN